MIRTANAQFVEMPGVLSLLPAGAPQPLPFAAKHCEGDSFAHAGPPDGGLGRVMGVIQRQSPLVGQPQGSATGVDLGEKLTDALVVQRQFAPARVEADRRQAVLGREQRFPIGGLRGVFCRLQKPDGVPPLLAQPLLKAGVDFLAVGSGRSCAANPVAQPFRIHQIDVVVGPVGGEAAKDAMLRRSREGMALACADTHHRPAVLPV